MIHFAVHLKHNIVNQLYSKILKINKELEKDINQ